MGFELLIGNGTYASEQKACFFCNVDERAFGPVRQADLMASAEIVFANRMKDPRNFTHEELVTFIDRVEAAMLHLDIDQLVSFRNDIASRFDPDDDSGHPEKDESFWEAVCFLSGLDREGAEATLAVAVASFWKIV